MMDFHEAHKRFVAQHLVRRTGERKRRLAEGHAHAEKLFCRNVWWKLRGNFDDLHPEYEVRDWRNRSYFTDFAYITPLVRIIIEIKGYQSHVVNMDRQKYCNELNRETFLFGAGYYVISFAYDDVEQRPDICITLLRMVLSKYTTIPSITTPSTAASSPSPTSPSKAAAATARSTDFPGSNMKMDLFEKEIIRYAALLGRPVKPIEVRHHLDIHYRYARRILDGLCAKGWFHPIYGADRKRKIAYELARHPLEYFSITSL